MTRIREIEIKEIEMVSGTVTVPEGAQVRETADHFVVAARRLPKKRALWVVTCSGMIELCVQRSGRLSATRQRGKHEHKTHGNSTPRG